MFNFLILKTNLTFFIHGSIDQGPPDNIRKNLPLTVDRFGYIEASISFFHIFQRTVKYDDHQTFLYECGCIGQTTNQVTFVLLLLPPILYFSFYLADSGEARGCSTNSSVIH